MSEKLPSSSSGGTAIMSIFSWAVSLLCNFTYKIVSEWVNYFWEWYSDWKVSQTFPSVWLIFHPHIFFKRKTRRIGLKTDGNKKKNCFIKVIRDYLLNDHHQRPQSLEEEEKKERTCFLVFILTKISLDIILWTTTTIPDIQDILLQVTRSPIGDLEMKSPSSLGSRGSFQSRSTCFLKQF